MSMPSASSPERIRCPIESPPTRLQNSTVPPRRAMVTAAFAADPPPPSRCSRARTLVGRSGNLEMRNSWSSAACPTTIVFAGGRFANLSSYARISFVVMMPFYWWRSVDNYSCGQIHRRGIITSPAWTTHKVQTHQIGRQLGCTDLKSRASARPHHHLSRCIR